LFGLEASFLKALYSKIEAKPTARNSGRWVFCFRERHDQRIGNAAPQPELESGKTSRQCAVARRLNHLQALEAESIYILREAAAEFARPVMLYSIGKDSSVHAALAQKAFYPGKIPFPLLHVDTSYKFPEMIEFRDSYPRQIGAELIVHKESGSARLRR